MSKGNDDDADAENGSTSSSEPRDREGATSTSPTKKPAAVSVGTKSKVPRKGAGAARKEKGMPSRPLSAYNLYFREARLHLMSESPRFQGQERSNNPGMFAELGKAIAERWKSISEEDLKKYKDLAALDMERYSREMSEYRLKRAKVRLREESAAAAAFEGHGVGSHRGLDPREGRSVGASDGNPVAVGDQMLSPGAASLPAFIDASLIRTNALLQSLQRRSEMVTPAPAYDLSSFMRPSLSQYPMLRRTHEDAPHEASSLVLQPPSPGQELDTFAVAQALRIRQLEGMVARQEERLQQVSEPDWRVTAVRALELDHLARTRAAAAGPATMATAGSVSGNAVPSAMTTSSSSWGRDPAVMSRPPETRRRDLFPSLFVHSSAATQPPLPPPPSLQSALRMDDPATTRALLEHLVSQPAQHSQESQSQQLHRLLQLQQQTQNRSPPPPSEPPLDPATRLMLLQRLLNDQRGGGKDDRK